MKTTYLAVLPVSVEETGFVVSDHQIKLTVPATGTKNIARVLYFEFLDNLQENVEVQSKKMIHFCRGPRLQEGEQAVSSLFFCLQN